MLVASSKFVTSCPKIDIHLAWKSDSFWMDKMLDSLRMKLKNEPVRPRQSCVKDVELVDGPT